MKLFTSLLFTGFYSYAVLRYHVSGKTEWKEWFFVLNKSFAWTAFILLSLTILKPKTLEKIQLNRRVLGLTGYGFAIVHLISVLFLFSEVHYPKFFTDSDLNLRGLLSISAGSIAILLFTLPFIASVKKLSIDSPLYKFGKYGVAISILHPFFIGFSGWVSPFDWPLCLPPITLLAFLSGVSFFLIRKFKS